MQSLETPLQIILDARQKADEDLAATRALAELLPVADQTSLMAEFGAVLSPHQATLSRWQLLQSGQITATVAMPASNLEAAVSSLEGSPKFRDVRSGDGAGANEAVIEAFVEESTE